MGIITIETRGSFGNRSRQFRAIEHGHAHAAQEAIAFLAEILRWSINRDHELHGQGESPAQGFEKGES